MDIADIGKPERRTSFEPPVERDLGWNGGIVSWNSLEEANRWLGQQKAFWDVVFKPEHSKRIIDAKSLGNNANQLINTVRQWQVGAFSKLNSRLECEDFLVKLAEKTIISKDALPYFYPERYELGKSIEEKDISNAEEIQFDTFSLIATTPTISTLRLHPNHDAFSIIISNGARISAQASALYRTSLLIESTYDKTFKNAAAKIAISLDAYGLNDEFIAAAKETVKSVENMGSEISDVKKDFQKITSDIDKSRNELSQKISKLDERANNAEETFSEKLLEAVEAYDTKEAINSTSKLWGSRASRAQLAFWISVAVLLGTIASVSGTIYYFRDAILPLLKEKAELNLYSFVVGAVVLGVFAVFLRLVARAIVMFLRQWQDANERVATIETFIHLQAKSLLVGETDRDYLLSAITRPGPEMEKDSEPSIGVVDAIAKAMSRRN